MVIFLNYVLHICYICRIKMTLQPPHTHTKPNKTTTTYEEIIDHIHVVFVKYQKTLEIIITCNFSCTAIFCICLSKRFHFLIRLKKLVMYSLLQKEKRKSSIQNSSRYSSLSHCTLLEQMEKAGKVLLCNIKCD